MAAVTILAASVALALMANDDFPKKVPISWYATTCLGQRGGKIENHIIAVMVIFCIPYKRICPNFRHSHWTQNKVIASFVDKAPFRLDNSLLQPPCHQSTHHPGHVVTWELPLSAPYQHIKASVELGSSCFLRNTIDSMCVLHVLCPV